MPIYEYRCQQCGRKQSIFWRSLSAVNEAGAKCERCGSNSLTRVMSKVRVVRAGSRNDAGAGPNDDAMMAEMANLDENDPRALGSFMRKMAAESGEDMGPEFDEVVGRLEKGEDPERIEKDMGDLFGGDEGAGMGGMGGMGDYDDPYGAPPENPTAKADQEAEAKDKKATEKRKTVAMKDKPKGKKTPAKKKGRK
jgi:putative FmdB family regulatory protein